jgi:pimeloyl-ACP methyl ester carboxylesterase
MRVSGHQRFSAATAAGALAGWTDGEGPPALLLHGGPGLGYEYMDPVADELRTDFLVATFQQRGLEPSTLQGPFTIAQAISDVLWVLEALGWDRVLLVGHSWGAHLALRFTAAHPDLLLGTLAIEPIGVVGDGGSSAFETELVARVPSDARQRLEALSAREQAGEATAEETLEAMAITWPFYFADPESAPQMPVKRFSNEVFAGLAGEMATDTDAVAAALAATRVRYGMLVGGASPIPWGQAARASAELSPCGALKVVPAAGHFVWFEAPGSVRAAALDLLSHDAAAAGAQNPSPS